MRHTLNISRLLKRRQIRGSRTCAEAAALLLRRVVESFESGDVSELIERVQQVGQRLVIAAPKELAIGNIVRRVLGLIREEAEEDREGEGNSYEENGPDAQSQPANPSKLTNASSSSMDADSVGLKPAPSSAAVGRSVFGLLSQPNHDRVPPGANTDDQSPASHQPSPRPIVANPSATKDLRAEVIEGVLEIVEELKLADEQIAGYALEHIHPNEVILIHTSSETVRKFLLKAATKRRFTVIHAETYPNEHEATHMLATGEKSKNNEDGVPGHFQKTLTAAGVTVIIIPDSAVFAVMARVNTVILDSHIILANGGLIGAAGAKQIAKSANVHRTPVIVLSGVYKFSPVYPINTDAFLEDGDPSRIVPYQDGDFMDKVEVDNPLFDYVPAGLVDLYVTNLGGHAPSYLYRIIADHYRKEDIELDALDPFQ